MMRCLAQGLAALAVFIAMASPSNADLITGLFNTGVNNSGTPLANGTADGHWFEVTSAGPPPVTATEFAFNSNQGFPIPPWIGDNSLSSWISSGTDTNEPAASINNGTSFTSPVSGIATLTGRWATDDNGGAITLFNGNLTATGTTSPGANFGAFTPFTLTGTVTPGLNFLDFVNVNSGGPGGLRVEFTSATVVPEPSTLILAGVGLVGLFAAARRRKA